MADWVVRTQGGVSWITYREAEEAGLLLAFTTRQGGVSRWPYRGLNLSLETGSASARRENLARLTAALELPVPPVFPRQRHTADLVVLDSVPKRRPLADGLLTRVPGLPLGVLVADCAPVVLWSPGGIAVLHCGWRGIGAGILEKGVKALAELSPGPLGAFVGPAIGMCCYEVGEEVAEALREGAYPFCHFARTGSGRFVFDLAGHVCDRLALAGVPMERIRVVGLCTSCDPDWFYSYRRDGKTGRCAGIAMIRGAGEQGRRQSGEASEHSRACG